MALHGFTSVTNHKVLNIYELSTIIKQRAQELGFAACGIAQANEVDLNVQESYMQWIEHGNHGKMDYLDKNHALRFSPNELLSNTRSIVVVAMNYKPSTTQDESLPQIAYYAYGRDYHKVIKKRLNKLLNDIQAICPTLQGRAFADSAPIMERYWAQKAGLGWIGKNGLLIIPKIGSYIVLGELFLDIELVYDKPFEKHHCGKCTNCIDQCPTQALKQSGIIDARRCISYMTIEDKGEIPSYLEDAMGNRLYGCDACQQCCPHNRNTPATTIEDFRPRNELLGLSIDEILDLTEEQFDKLSEGSPIRRAGLAGIQKTALKLLKSLDKSPKTKI